MVLVSVAAFALTSARTDAGGSTLIADDPGWPHWKACEDDEARIHSEKGLCRLGSDSADPEFIFWGDSHAIALASAVNLSARRNDVAGVIATRTACPPLLGIERPGRTSCDEFNRTISRYIQERPSIHSVVLTARWALSTKGTRYKEEDGRSVTLVDTLVDGSDRNNVELFEAGLRRTLEYLVDSELDVTLVGPIPEVGFDVPSSNYIARLTGRDINEEIAPTAEEFNERTREVSEVFMRIREDFPISIVSPASLLCNGDRCDVVRNSTPVYRDNNHLSIFGAQFVSPVFDDTFAAIANRRAPQDPGRR